MSISPSLQHLCVGEAVALSDNSHFFAPDFFAALKSYADTTRSNPKSESRNPKQIRNTKLETRASTLIRISDFVFVSDFDIRISNFRLDIRISDFRPVVFAHKIHHPQILLLILQRHQLQNLRLLLQRRFAVLAGLVQAERLGQEDQGGGVVFLAGVDEGQSKPAADVAGVDLERPQVGGL